MPVSIQGHRAIESFVGDEADDRAGDVIVGTSAVVTATAAASVAPSH
jgi:hypothetical protein